MADMEVHEHVIGNSNAKVGQLRHALVHHNVESLSHYIQKHDKYSNWDARVWFEGKASTRELSPHLLDPRRSGVVGCASFSSAYPVPRRCFSSTNTSCAWDFSMVFPA